MIDLDVIFDPEVIEAAVSETYRTGEIASQSWAQRAATLLASVQDDIFRTACRDAFEERAAICHYDGGLTLDEAEHVAYEELCAALHGGKVG